MERKIPNERSSCITSTVLPNVWPKTHDSSDGAPDKLVIAYSSR